MTGSEKSPEMIKVLDDITQKMFGRTRTGSQEKNLCVMCGGPADAFKDALSKKEYGISGMCQKCQDEIW